MWTLAYNKKQLSGIQPPLKISHVLLPYLSPLKIKFQCFPPFLFSHVSRFFFIFPTFPTFLFFPPHCHPTFPAISQPRSPVAQPRFPHFTNHVPRLPIPIFHIFPTTFPDCPSPFSTFSQAMYFNSILNFIYIFYIRRLDNGLDNSLSTHWSTICCAGSIIDLTTRCRCIDQHYATSILTTWVTGDHFLKWFWLVRDVKSDQNTAVYHVFLLVYSIIFNRSKPNSTSVTLFQLQK